MELNRALATLTGFLAGDVASDDLVHELAHGFVDPGGLGQVLGRRVPHGPWRLGEVDEQGDLDVVVFESESGGRLEVGLAHDAESPSGRTMLWERPLPQDGLVVRRASIHDIGQVAQLTASIPLEQHGAVITIDRPPVSLLSDHLLAADESIAIGEMGGELVGVQRNLTYEATQDSVSGEVLLMAGGRLASAHRGHGHHEVISAASIADLAFGRLLGAVWIHALDNADASKKTTTTFSSGTAPLDRLLVPVDPTPAGDGRRPDLVDVVRLRNETHGDKAFYWPVDDSWMRERLSRTPLYRPSGLHGGAGGFVGVAHTRDRHWEAADPSTLTVRSTVYDWGASTGGDLVAALGEAARACPPPTTHIAIWMSPNEPSYPAVADAAEIVEHYLAIWTYPTPPGATPWIDPALL